MRSKLVSAYTIGIFFLSTIFMDNAVGQNWASTMDCLEGVHGRTNIIVDEEKIRLLINQDYSLIMATFTLQGILQDIKSKSKNEYYYFRPVIADSKIYVLSSSREYEDSKITITQYNFDLDVLSTISLKGTGKMIDFEVFENHIYLSRSIPEVGRALLEKFTFDGIRQDSFVMTNSGRITSRLDVFNEGSILLKGSSFFRYLNSDFTEKYNVRIEQASIANTQKVDNTLYVSGYLKNVDEFYIASFNNVGDMVTIDTFNVDRTPFDDMFITDDESYFLAQAFTECLVDYSFYKLDVNAQLICTLNINEYDCTTKTIAPSNFHVSPNGVYFGAGKLIDGKVIPSLFHMDSSCNAENILRNECNTTDADNDGFNSFVDCDDNDAMVNPDVEEIIYNGIDDDCNIFTLDDDLDRDGFTLEDDCDDNNREINPGQTEEAYNGIDDDCNPATLDDDLDQDGFLLADDCDDTNPNINPDQEEIPNNGIDEDCDGLDMITSIHKIANTTVKIYPNPASEIINVDVKGDLSLKISLFDFGGKLINSITNTNQLEVNSIPSGIYFLKLKDSKSGEIVIEKIVIEK